MSTLAELEQRAVDGKPVSPAEMAQALAADQAADRIASLAASGKEQRAAEKAAADLARRQAEVKAQAGQVLANLRAKCDERRQATLDALASFTEACDAYGAAVTERAQQFREAGIPTAWTASLDPRTDLPVVEGEPLDPQNYAQFVDGSLRVLVTAGVTHAPTLYNAEVHLQNVVSEARTAYAVAKASRG